MPPRASKSPDGKPAPGTSPGIQYTARTRDVYYLHALTGKNGKPRYHFSIKPPAQPVPQIPDGFEIHENIRGQVFLRRRTAQLITPAEVALVDAALGSLRSPNFCRQEVKKNSIVIHEAENQSESLRKVVLPWLNAAPLEDYVSAHAVYMAVMRFTLVEAEGRKFIVERFCFRGSVDDWIFLDGPAPLAAHLKSYLKHLGKESLYDLY